MVGLTVSMHFQQFEDLKFQNVSGEARLGPPILKPLCSRNLHGLPYHYNNSYLVPVLEVCISAPPPLQKSELAWQVFYYQC